MQTDVTAVRDPSMTVGPRHHPRSLWETRVVIITILVVGLALSAVVLLALRDRLPTPTTGTANTLPPTVKAPYPLTVGIADPLEPSGMSPPSRYALAGYSRTYAVDFAGAALPVGWQVFTGKPGGVPNGQFAASHVVVANGMLQLNTFQDPAFANKWTTGGLCQCNRPLLYGAVFVRSRITGPGTNEVELLWPPSNVWPPEVDFNETGPRAASTSFTVHWGAQNTIYQRTLLINMTQWHTWGVIWTPTTLKFVVDGKIWGCTSSVAASGCTLEPGGIPHEAMTLDLQQRPACSNGVTCSATTQSMLVDWVAEYQRP